MRHSHDDSYCLWRVNGHDLLIYDCLYNGTSETVKGFWKVPTLTTEIKHIGCAANPEADLIIGLSTDGANGWFFHQYLRKGTNVQVQVQNAKQVLGFDGSRIIIKL